MHLISVTPADVFQALSDPIRIRILRVLIKSEEESCQCELADSLLEPEYKLSRHLKVLRQAGLLSATKEGRWVYHKLVTGGSFLGHLHTAIRNIPDQDKQFSNDVKRFKQRSRLREGGKCQTPPRVRLPKKQNARDQSARVN